MNQRERVAGSFAKKAAAFFRISRSSRTWRFSLRSCASSSRSAVVSLVRPRVRFARARWTHVRRRRFRQIEVAGDRAHALALVEDQADRLALKSSSNRRRDRRLLVVSAIGVDILSAFRKGSTKLIKPMCQMWRLMRANVLPSVGLEHEALDDARKAVQLDEGFWLGWAGSWAAFARRHQHAEAMPCAERAMAGAPWCPYSIGLMAPALANEGRPHGAQSLLAALRGDAYGGPVGLAVYYLARGENRAGRRMGRQSGRTALPGDRPASDSRVRAVAAAFCGVAKRVEEDEPRTRRTRSYTAVRECLRRNLPGSNWAWIRFTLCPGAPVFEGWRGCLRAHVPTLSESRRVAQPDGTARSV